MGWTGYISVFGKTADPGPEVISIIQAECSKFLVLPGSEALIILDNRIRSAQYSSASADHKYFGYSEILTACSKVQSSLNPMLSLWSMMRIAKRLASRLGDDYLVEFKDDYRTYNRPVNQLTNLDLFLYGFMACILAPFFLLLNFRVLFER